jgi:hypothetical protein
MHTMCGKTIVNDPARTAMTRQFVLNTTAK